MSINRSMEKGIERIVSVAIAILGNSFALLLAVCAVIFYFTNDRFYTQDVHYSIGDIILGITFLSLFIIQKSFNRFSALLHLKINELVSSHESASNAVINLEGKTERELKELSKKYAESDLEKEEEILPV